MSEFEKFVGRVEGKKKNRLKKAVEESKPVVRKHIEGLRKEIEVLREAHPLLVGKKWKRIKFPYSERTMLFILGKNKALPVFNVSEGDVLILGQAEMSDPQVQIEEGRECKACAWAVLGPPIGEGEEPILCVNDASDMHLQRVNECMGCSLFEKRVPGSMDFRRPVHDIGGRIIGERVASVGLNEKKKKSTRSPKWKKEICETCAFFEERTFMVTPFGEGRTAMCMVDGHRTRAGEFACKSWRGKKVVEEGSAEWHVLEAEKRKRLEGVKKKGSDRVEYCRNCEFYVRSSRRCSKAKAPRFNQKRVKLTDLACEHWKLSGEGKSDELLEAERLTKKLVETAKVKKIKFVKPQKVKGEKCDNCMHSLMVESKKVGVSDTLKCDNLDVPRYGKTVKGLRACVVFEAKRDDGLPLSFTEFSKHFCHQCKKFVYEPTRQGKSKVKSGSCMEKRKGGRATFEYVINVSAACKWFEWGAPLRTRMSKKTGTALLDAKTGLIVGEYINKRIILKHVVQPLKRGRGRPRTRWLRESCGTCRFYVFNHEEEGFECSHPKTTRGSLLSDHSPACATWEKRGYKKKAEDKVEGNKRRVSRQKECKWCAHCVVEDKYCKSRRSHVLFTQDASKCKDFKWKEESKEVTA